MPGVLERASNPWARSAAPDRPVWLGGPGKEQCLPIRQDMPSLVVSSAMIGIEECRCRLYGGLLAVEGLNRFPSGP